MKTKKQAQHKTWPSILLIICLAALACTLRAWLSPVAAAFANNPNPVVDLQVPDHEFPDKALINEEFEYIARVYTEDQTPVKAGFSPYLRLILPPKVTLASATILGVCNAPSCTDASETPVNVTGPKPFNSLNSYTAFDTLSVPGKNIVLNTEAPLLANQDANLYLIEAPIGSLYPSEPGVYLKLKLKIDKTAKLGVPLPVYHQPVFRFGEDALTGSSMEGAWNVPTVTPVAAILTKRALNYPSNLAPPAPTVEAPTGSCNALDFELIVNIANGVTLNNLKLSDLFPNQLVYVKSSTQGSGASGIAITDNTNTNGGGTLDALVPTDTGLPNSAPGGTRDVVISFKAWVNNFLNVTVCEPQVIVNQATLDATLDATFNFEPVQDKAALSIAVKHVTLQKYAAGPLAPPFEKLVVPNDTVNYRLEFQVSQDIYLKVPEISDKLPNGLLYGGAAQVSFNGGGWTPISASVGAPDPNDGSTTITFDLPNLSACTTGRIRYQGKVQQAYLTPLSSAVLASDKLSNFAEIQYLIGNKYGAGCKDFGAAEVLVRPVNILKEIVNPQAEYLPGDIVHFRLQMNLPSGDTQKITFKDFLPQPIFNAAQATNIHLASIPCNVASGFTPTKSATDNSLTFNFTPDPLATSTVFATTPKPCVAVEFDVPVTLNPYNDKISLTNIFQSTTENTPGEVDGHLAGVQVLVRAPKLRVTKGVYTTSNAAVNQANGLPSNQNPVNNNVTGVNAGDEVTFYITIENTGGAPAYNVKVEDFLPPELIFVSSWAVSGPAVSPTGTTPLTFKYNALTALPAGAKWVLCVKAKLNTELQACQNPLNKAQAFWASHNGKSLTPVFFAPVGDTATLTTPAPTIAKKLLSHTPGAQVKVGEQVVYEVTVCLPKGTMNVTVNDLLPPGLTFVNAQFFNPNSIVGLPATGTTYTTAGPWTFSGVKPANFAVAGNCFSLQVRGQVAATVTDKQALINKATVKAGLCAEQTANAPEVIVSRPAIELTKKFTPPVVSPGQTVQIQLTVTNTSSTPTSVQVQDQLAAGLTALTAASSACTTVINGQLVTSACTLAPGQTATISITAQVAGNVNCKVIPNRAVANYSQHGQTSGSTTASANLLVTTPDCPCTAPPQAMVDWWRFNETSGPIAHDIRLNDNYAQYGAGGAAPTPTTPGFVKAALCFDGGDDYAEASSLVGAELDFAAGESLTIDAWIRTGMSGGTAPLLDKRLTTAPYTGYHLFLSNGRLGVQFNGSTFIAAANTPNLADNYWHFVAVTFSRSGTPLQIKLIADGLTLQTFAPTTASLGALTNPNPLQIGRRPLPLGGGYFRGCLDELEIFKRALSEEELFKLYAAGMGGKCQ